MRPGPVAAGAGQDVGSALFHTNPAALPSLKTSLVSDQGRGRSSETLLGLKYPAVPPSAMFKLRDIEVGLLLSCSNLLQNYSNYSACGGMENSF